jgi:2-hydroxy-3-keto-5-methylthiopentenyl-1-phosphate phosphatase
MILNYQELDKKVEKILNVLFRLGFSYEIFSNQRINIIDNNVTFAEKGNIGVIVQKSTGHVSLRIYGHNKRVSFKRLFGKNEVIFKPGQSLADVGMITRKMLKKYEEVNKKL